MMGDLPRLFLGLRLVRIPPRVVLPGEVEYLTKIPTIGYR